MRQILHVDLQIARRVTDEGGSDACVRPCTPANEVAGPYQGTGNDNPRGAQLADLLTCIAGADFTAIASGYDRGAALHYPGGLDTEGHDGAEQFWMGLRAAVPDAAFTVHHAIRREDPLMPSRASVRWSFHGRHSGWGRFGKPTGAELYIMGFTHAGFGPMGLRREFTLFDEVAVQKQILLATGAA